MRSRAFGIGIRRGEEADRVGWLAEMGLSGALVGMFSSLVPIGKSTRIVKSRQKIFYVLVMSIKSMKVPK